MVHELHIPSFPLEVTTKQYGTVNFHVIFFTYFTFQPFLALSIPDPNLDYYVDVTRLYRQRYIMNEEALPGNCSQGTFSFFS
jgi:hypothetical protein